jgi:hypothetical protein
MIDHMQLQFCAAAEKYANAGALVADAGGNDAWRFLIAQARELCEDGREFGTRENMLLAIEIPPINQSPRQAVHRRSFWSARLM